MAGFENDIVFALNGDFTQSDNQAPAEANGLVTNGQLWIGSTALNAGSTHINVGTLTSPNASITFGYSSPNITAVVNTSVVTDFHVARFIVSAGGLTDGANYTTIASAITAASAAGGVQTVFIQPGTYTENLTLVANVNLSAFVCDAYTPNVTIVGTLTGSFAGSASISNINLQTNGSFAIVLSGAAATNLNFLHCFINGTNNTPISYTSSDATSDLNFYDCVFDQAVGTALFSSSGAGTLQFNNCISYNNGGSTTATTFSSGILKIQHCIFKSPITTTGGQVNAFIFSQIDTAGINTTALTVASTVGVLAFAHCAFSGGTASAISVGAGASIILTHAIVGSSNANAIAGTGTINYALISFISTSSTVAAGITQTPLATLI